MHIILYFKTVLLNPTTEAYTCIKAVNLCKQFLPATPDATMPSKEYRNKNMYMSNYYNGE